MADAEVAYNRKVAISDAEAWLDSVDVKETPKRKAYVRDDPQTNIIRRMLAALKNV